ERGKFAFGAVSDQNKLAPDTVVTSFILDEDKAYEPIVKQVNDGKFVGKIYTPGLEATKNSTGDGIVTLAPFHGFENKIPNSYKQKINELAKEILDKKLIVKEMFNIS
ncbi:MAG: BMP family lipoprotein, partial [Candidatus Eiseniibacteriota bacterium]